MVVGVGDGDVVGCHLVVVLTLLVVRSPSRLDHVGFRFGGPWAPPPPPRLLGFLPRIAVQPRVHLPKDDGMKSCLLSCARPSLKAKVEEGRTVFWCLTVCLPPSVCRLWVRDGCSKKCLLFFFPVVAKHPEVSPSRWPVLFSGGHTHDLFMFVPSTRHPPPLPSPLHSPPTA